MTNISAHRWSALFKSQIIRCVPSLLFVDIAYHVYHSVQYLLFSNKLMPSPPPQR